MTYLAYISFKGVIALINLPRLFNCLPNGFEIFQLLVKNLINFHICVNIVGKSRYQPGEARVYQSLLIR